MNEHRVKGPPGCGKTTFLQHEVHRCAAAHGSESVLVMSLTRAAAAEVAGRNLPLDRSQIGTLHSHAYHALDRPSLTADKDKLEDWNQWVKTHHHPNWQLTGKIPRDEWGFVDHDEATIGDEYFSRMETYRALRVPRSEWQGEGLLKFAEEWESWKERTLCYDFSDLIEKCIERVPVAPGNPQFLFVDEAQDLSKLELELVRRWGKRAERLTLCGDEDQALYNWRGASAQNFLTPAIPESNFRELTQSYRVPREPHRVALEWIRQIKDRHDVDYRPRNERGRVERVPAVYMRPELVFQDAEKKLAAGKSVMFLATAAYMLKPLLRFFRSEGIPFHNPYVERRGDWNPLKRRRGSTTLAERVGSFLSGKWLDDANALRLWLDLLKLDHFRSDKTVTKDSLRKLDGKITTSQLASIFRPDALKAALSAPPADLDWLRKGLLKQYASGGRAGAFDYICRIAEHHGPTALNEKPKTIVGTVHSVKGGESDCVYVFPDISRAASEEWFRSEDGRSAATRVMYVAFTRAKETLVVCDPASSRAIDLRSIQTTAA